MRCEKKDNENKKSSYSGLPASYSLQEIVQNHYSEPGLWDKMVRIHRRL
jgi:hypothetical protein